MRANNSGCFAAKTGRVACLLTSLVIFSPSYGQEQNNSVSAWEKDLPESIGDLQAIQNQIQSKLQMVRNTVVSVEAEDGAGSGVLVSADGLILTAAHVIGESGRKMDVVFPNGYVAEALSLGGSELSDAGMLKIIEPGQWDYAPIALAGKSGVGDWCFSLGHPSGYNEKRGSVLRVGRVIHKKEETIQTDCRLLGGDSGGPLFSIDGEVIGIHSRISQSPEDNFHTTIESFLSNWEFFLNEELHTYVAMQKGGFLGVLCEDFQDGLQVVEVVAETPAEDAGIRKGDLFRKLDGIPLDTREKLSILVSSKPPGSFVVIDYLRDGKEISVRIKLGERFVKE